MSTDVLGDQQLAVGHGVVLPAAAIEFHPQGVSRIAVIGLHATLVVAVERIVDVLFLGVPAVFGVAIRRPDAYFKANYYSQDDNLISWGAEQIL